MSSPRVSTDAGNYVAEENKPRPKKRIVEVDLRDLLPLEDAQGGAAKPAPQPRREE